MLLSITIIILAAWIGTLQRGIRRHEVRWHGNDEWPEIVCE